MIDFKKYQLDTHIYSSPLDAKVAAESLGLGPVWHVHQVNGQAYYMPGETHMDYLRSQGYEEKEEVSEDRMVEAIRAVVAEIMNKSFLDWGEQEEITKAEYQGEEVELNKPRRLSGGEKKFEVFVRDGDKVKRVTFGDADMEIRRDDDEARANFRARHNCDSKKDKTTAGYWACRAWEKDTTVGELTKSSHGDFKILKTDDEQRLIYGWASVSTVKGELIVDKQGDAIEMDTLEKAVNDFMEHVRVGKTMHVGDQTGAVIHSLPISKSLCEALGIQSDMEGWVVGYKVYDDNTWEGVKSGKYASFSIGGKAVKEEYDA